jgi:hypothetical protein
MIKTEFYKKREDGIDLYRTYSDENKYIKQVETGTEYIDAIDEADENRNIRYTYEETDRDIETEEVSTEIELKAQAYDILVGEVE